MSAFLRLLTYVRRTVLRARTRSLLTILGTALAMGLFAFVRTLEGGVNRLSESSNMPVLVVFQTSRFCPLTRPRSHGSSLASTARRFSSESDRYRGPPNTVASPPFAAYFASINRAARSIRFRVVR